MKQSQIITLIVLLLLTGCGRPSSVQVSTTPTASDAMPSATPSATPSLRADLAPKIEALLDRYAEQRQFAGSILVAQHGVILATKAYGMAKREQRLPNTPQTRFRIGSLTKQFTAMAILMLQAQGKLNVQDGICSYLPACPPRWQPITIHQLLTHTSGIPNLTSLFEYKNIRTLSLSPTELIARFSSKSLDFRPGSKWSYSNSGYIVLGAIIERVSGQSYEAFLQEHVFTPLGMANTGYEHDASLLATGYTAFGTVADELNMSIPYAAGSLYSTVEDLYRWDQAFATEQLVPKELRETMLTASKPGPDSGGYGYGWFIDEQYHQQRFWHDGLIDGFTAIYSHYPVTQVAIIILSNQQGADVGSLESMIAQVILETP